MGPVDIIMVAEELEEQARVLRLIAGDVKGNLEFARERVKHAREERDLWVREANNDQQT